MQNIQLLMQKPLRWLAGVIAAELLKPLEEIKTRQEKQGNEIASIKDSIERKHKADPIAEECDLAMLDYLICQRIEGCRAKGYTTAEDRRIVGRMHIAYKARGGNYGEEVEYAIFESLPTREEFMRATKGETA